MFMYFILESRIETQTLPASEMGGEDKVSEWLSTQNEAEDRDSADSSIEVMREEVVTGK